MIKHEHELNSSELGKYFLYGTFKVIVIFFSFAGLQFYKESVTAERYAKMISENTDTTYCWKCNPNPNNDGTTTTLTTQKSFIQHAGDGLFTSSKIPCGNIIGPAFLPSPYFDVILGTIELTIWSKTYPGSYINH